MAVALIRLGLPRGEATTPCGLTFFWPSFLAIAFACWRVSPPCPIAVPVNASTNAKASANAMEMPLCAIPFPPGLSLTGAQRALSNRVGGHPSATYANLLRKPQLARGWSVLHATANGHGRQEEQCE